MLGQVGDNACTHIPGCFSAQTLSKGFKKTVAVSRDAFHLHIVRGLGFPRNTLGRRTLFRSTDSSFCPSGFSSIVHLCVRLVLVQILSRNLLSPCNSHWLFDWRSHVERFARSRRGNRLPCMALVITDPSIASQFHGMCSLPSLSWSFNSYNDFFASLNFNEIHILLRIGLHPPFHLFAHSFPGQHLEFSQASTCKFLSQGTSRPISRNTSDAPSSGLRRRLGAPGLTYSQSIPSPGNAQVTSHGLNLLQVAGPIKFRTFLDPLNIARFNHGVVPLQRLHKPGTFA